MKNIDLKKQLKKVFGYKNFRGSQENIIKYLLDGKDLLVIMPTGSGKSLCYQLPATIKPGLAIVISPLLALMKDQVDFLNSIGINSVIINSTLTKKQLSTIQNNIIEHKVKMLYIAPESFTKEDTIAFLKKVNISFVAVDEAHCISEWGHNFRPEYRRIQPYVESLSKGIPIIALTATATDRVQKDILHNLKIDTKSVFKTSFKRENLYFETIPKIDQERFLINYIHKHKNKTGIIYCHSRKTVEGLSDFLNINKIKAVPYHAGLDKALRIKNQEGFLNEKVNIIVATIAFGMGINKSDVRFVIHYDVPKSLEGYYQETGRAGRDQLPSECTLLFDDKDAVKLEKYNKDKPVTEKINAKHLIDEVRIYARTPICRMNQLLYYFGEVGKFKKIEKNYNKNINDNGCKNCDNCRNKLESYNAKDYILSALKCISELGGKFDEKYIAQVISGQFSSNIETNNHNNLEFFGKGINFGDYDSWRILIRQLLFINLCDRDENFLISLNKNSDYFIQNPYDIKLHKSNFLELEKKMQSSCDKKADKNSHYNIDVFSVLCNLRQKIADKKNIQPYLVFSDSILEDMSSTFPITLEALAKISNVGMSKAKKFGKEFVTVIRKYLDEHDDISPIDTILYKQEPSTQKEILFLIKQIDKKIDLEELAQNLNIELEELLKEIEEIARSGIKLDINYFIDIHISKDRQEDIYEYFKETKKDDVEKAIVDLEYEYDEVEVRLMHIKFLSEFAN